MKKINYIAILATALTTMPTLGFSQNLATDQNAPINIGVNVGQVDYGYQGDASTVVMPHAFFDNHRFYVEGSEIGFYPTKTSKQQARLGLTYDGRAFDPKDAPTPFSAVEKRKPSVLAHASYMYITPVGGIRLKVGHDVLGVHNGTTATIAHVSRFSKNDTTIYPSFGLMWHDKKYNDYYYGVDEQESNQSGLPIYRASASFSPYASMMVNHQLNDKISIFGHGRLEWLSNERKQSPISQGRTASVVRIGASYNFR